MEKSRGRGTLAFLSVQDPRQVSKSAPWLVVEPEVELATLDDRVTPAESVILEAATKPRVLLIEDDWRTQSALRKILGRLGWEVHSAMTVSGGLALLDLRPEAVVLDLMLPDGDGIVVLRKLRTEHPQAKVAVTTGVEDTIRLEEIRSLKPDALLRKPLELGDLLRALGIDRTL